MQHLQNNNETTLLENKEPWLATAGTLYEKHTSQIKETLETVGTVKKQVNIAGFTIPISDDEATKAFRKKIVTDTDNANALKQKLSIAGITPIAILPKDIFDKIIAKAGFYSFYRIQPDNKVYGNGKAYQLSKNPTDTQLIVAIIVYVLSVIGMPFLQITYAMYWLIVAMFTVIHLPIVWRIQISTDAEKSSNFREHVVRICISLILAFGPGMLLCVICFSIQRYIRHSKRLKQTLWPKFNDVEDVTHDLFSLQLPEPPPAIKSLLAKCYGTIPTFLTIHPNAFRVVVSKETKRALWIKYDPVICTQENNMVAVLDQFGEFPEEKEVIAYIAEHFDAIRNDLLPLQAN